MKVNTDSLILGSWAEPGPAKHVLDIGTGSGILALMMAQKLEHSFHSSADEQRVDNQQAVRIDAIEIDENATAQAALNFKNSKWANQLFARCCDVNSFTSPYLYDVVISNPPYFDSPAKRSNAYNQQSQPRNVARQALALSAEEFFEVSQEMLELNGHLYCVYPFSLEARVIQIAASYSFALEKQLYVRHESNSTPYLCAFHFRKLALTSTLSPIENIGVINEEASKTTLTIRDAQGNYTSEYKALCQPFYLKF
ncbi:DUF890 domain-containing protein [Alteromonas portus]|uniref:tRNA1(Val) (adenine(37)-N6)-methyltransferase n=1 Tax=Alteromonas portus TaxID=2565549 RepID=A0A4U0Z537_9ALTE|nr:methyltransferase [Alteromonas portus]TKB00761.1 DUF890 domain-containing protein [Alteromonas portus]